MTLKGKSKETLHNRLFIRVYINYASMVVLFAIILGSIYLNLSEKSTVNSFRNQLTTQGRAASKRFTEFIMNKDYDRYNSYLEMLKEIGIDEIIPVSNPNARVPMDKDMLTVELDTVLESGDYEQVLNEAFANKESYHTSYSETYGGDIISVGIPILGANSEVCGALLINSKMDTLADSLASTKSLVVSSAILALLVAFVLAIIFARELTSPITKMRQTALKLAEQKYETKTGIKRNDEIGDLAKTIDLLTDKLMENEKVRNNLEQMRMDFFANVSHELRTPITVVRAYTESLVDGVVTDEASKQMYYEKMLSECKSMERLVGDLLILSKMQNPDFVIEKEPVSLTQIFDDVARTVKTMGEEKNIQIKLTYDDDVCLMYGDYDRLRQMFLVICDNAIKFSPVNSTIYITIEKGEKLVAHIRDEGIGIPKNELGSIFDKFYKSKLRQNAKGSGLGLAIARQICLKHGGTIEVKSEVGIGTEFIFTFDSVSVEELEQ